VTLVRKANMLSASKTYDNQRKHLKSWEKQFPWLKPSTRSGSRKSWCSVCKSELIPKLAVIKVHDQGKKHKDNLKELNSNKKMTDVAKLVQVRQKVKETEVKLALTTACHMPIHAIDHLSEVLVDTGGVLSDLRLHRTKCTALIKSVLSPWMKNTIKVDMRGKKYSLLVDETTDISVEKICAICARYFSEMESKVVTVFLGLYRTIHTTGAEVFSVIENCIAEYNLVIEYMIGFGCWV